MQTIIKDPNHKKVYKTGNLLGKGGFAKCYELIDETGHVFAGKIISLEKVHRNENQKEKMKMEIQINRILNHENIVKFHSFFEDQTNIYVLLELCRHRTLLEVHKRRRTITRPELRFYMKGVIHGCIYLHSLKVIHRDLKLANICLGDGLQPKISDFGLATRVDLPGERKRTMCGTPNYIAPEILNKIGHSFEVDIWSLGCIIYTLLIGVPPFETKTLSETYDKIKRNDYNIPITVERAAIELIRTALDPQPERRPSMKAMLNYEFFKLFTPQALPESALTTEPRFDQVDASGAAGASYAGGAGDCGDIHVSAGTGTHHTAGMAAAAANGTLAEHDRLVIQLLRMLAHLVKSPIRVFDENSRPPPQLSSLAQQQLPAPSSMEESEDPNLVPIFWFTKWVDYSDKYGLGYQLCDNSSGVVFNDQTRIILTSNNHNLQYVNEKGVETFWTIEKYPDDFEKKVSLLKYFQKYMNHNLLTAGEDMASRSNAGMERLPFVQRWFRTKSAILLFLTNGTLQVNFFEDHTKIICCPCMRAVTYIDPEKVYKTYAIDLLKQHGITKTLYDRIAYVLRATQDIYAITDEAQS